MRLYSRFDTLYSNMAGAIAKTEAEVHGTPSTNIHDMDDVAGIIRYIAVWE